MLIRTASQVLGSSFGWLPFWSRIRDLVRDGVWGLMDQALVSLSNFLTMIVSARALGEGAFGAFAIVYSLMFLVSRVQNALIGQPQYVLGVVRQGDAYATYTTTNGVAQLGLAILAAFGGFGGALIAYLLGHHGYAALFLAFVPAVAFWQLQDFGRSVMYSEERLRSAFLNDLLSYGAQPIILILFWRLGEMSGPRVLLVIAGTSFVAMLVAARQIRTALRGRVSSIVIRDNWQFGKWLAGANLGNWLSSEAFLYLAGAMLESSAAGVLKAADVLFGPLRMLEFFACTVLPVRFSRAFASDGESILREKMRISILIFAPVFALYCLAITVLSGPLIRLLYGSEFSNVSQVVGILAVGAFSIGISSLISNGLKVLRQTRAVFFGSLFSAFLAILGGWILIQALGIDGAAISMVLASVLNAALFWFAYRSEPPGGVQLETAGGRQ